MKFLVVLALIAMALAEPEADPALVYTTNTLPLTTSALHPPLVYNTQALQKHLVYTTTGVHHPLVYNSAVQTPLVFPSYGKREAEAEAEPEAEADPALIYTNTLPAVHSTVHSPVVYKSTVHTPLVYNSAVKTPIVYNSALQTPLVYNSAVKTPVVYNSTVQTPLVYNSAVQTPLVYNTPLVNTVYNTPLTTPFMTKIFPSLKTMSTPAVSHITKREAEAEADPALVYTTAGVHQPIVYNSALQTPLVYNSAVQTPLVYKTPLVNTVYNTAVPAVHSPLLKTVDNAVVPAVGGYIHSSHVGVCTNNVGVRVPC